MDCFFAKRLAINEFTSDSTRAVEISGPARHRSHVSPKFFYCLFQLLELRIAVLEVVHQNFDVEKSLQGSSDLAMPQVPLGQIQRFSDLTAQISVELN